MADCARSMLCQRRSQQLRHETDADVVPARRSPRNVYADTIRERVSIIHVYIRMYTQLSIYRITAPCSDNRCSAVLRPCTMNFFFLLSRVYASSFSVSLNSPPKYSSKYRKTNVRIKYYSGTFPFLL